MQFIFHVLISAVIFAIIASGFKMFIKVKGNLDFSYIAIIIFTSYIAALLNIHFDIGLLGTSVISFLVTIPFTFLILFLSKKLDNFYFSIGTLAIYMLVYQLAYNMEGITGGAFGLSGISRNLIGNISLQSLRSFLLYSAIVLGILIVCLLYFKKTYIFKIITGWGEKEIAIRSLGINISLYKFILILITTLLASIAGNLYTFYYLYIDPSSFWFTMLVPTCIIVFLSYKRNDIGTFIVASGVLLLYEYLRFFKIVDTSKTGYFREIVFSLIIVVVTFLIFRKIQFGREE